MSLIIAKNKVDFEQLMEVNTPAGTETFTPIPHALLVDLTTKALENAGLEVTEQEHALARGGLRYFGGFALAGNDITGEDRRIVLGLRNAHDKSFAASIAVGNQMLVCENLCFASDVKLARKHTVNILADLPRVLSSAVARVVSHWNDMSARIEAYKELGLTNEQAADLLITLVDSAAMPARNIYSTIQEFRSPRHDEFKGGTLWTLYNAFTENLKGGDLSKLPQRTMTAQSIFDKLTGHVPNIVEVEVEETVEVEVVSDEPASETTEVVTGDGTEDSPTVVVG